MFRFIRQILGEEAWRYLDSETRCAITREDGARLRVIGSNGKTAMGLVDTPLASTAEGTQSGSSWMMSVKTPVESPVKTPVSTVEATPVQRTSLSKQFNPKVRLEFHGATITSDAGLLPIRELDDALGLTHIAADYLQESRSGRNIRHHLVPLLRQSIYSRLAGYDDTK